MARWRFIPEDTDRLEQAAEEKAERRAAKKGEAIEESWFEGLDPEAPEFASLDEFVNELVDSDAEEFDHRQLKCLSFRLQTPVPQIRKELEGWGFKLAQRRKPQQFRGFKSNPHNKYEGNPMCGGGGGNAIIGLAG